MPGLPEMRLRRFQGESSQLFPVNFQEASRNGFLESQPVILLVLPEEFPEAFPKIFPEVVSRVSPEMMRKMPLRSPDFGASRHPRNWRADCFPKTSQETATRETPPLRPETHRSDCLARPPAPEKTGTTPMRRRQLRQLAAPPGEERRPASGKQCTGVKPRSSYPRSPPQQGALQQSVSPPGSSQPP